MKKVKKRINRTSFLLPNIGFLIGMGSAFNIGGNYFLFNSSDTDNEADCKAMRSDWEMIGEDFKVVLNKSKMIDEC